MLLDKKYIFSFSVSRLEVFVSLTKQHRLVVILFLFPYNSRNGDEQYGSPQFIWCFPVHTFSEPVLVSHPHVDVSHVAIINGAA